MKRRELAYDLFKEYYANISEDKIFVPPNMDAREFAFQLFGSEGMMRHISFKKLEELIEYLKLKVPKHAYYSTAYFLSPSMPEMSSKGWIGADLVFDIDADHIETACKKEHDKWECLNCGEVGVGMTPAKCPHCGSSRIEAITWICDRCIEEARREAVKLIEEFIVPDLGINPNDITIVFSGHRGFHIHVRDRRYMKLDSNQRREIVDYIKGLGIRVDLLGLKYSRKPNPLGPDILDPSWRGRIAKGVVDILMERPEILLTWRSDKKDVIKSIAREASENILRYPSNWLLLKSFLKTKIEDFINHVVEVYACKIDEKVTIDIHRLIRLPGTLHGKTGLIVSVLSKESLEKFSVDDSLSPFKGEAYIEIIDAPPPIPIMGYSIEWSKGKIKVPLSLAVYLMLRGAAKIIKII